MKFSLSKINFLNLICTILVFSIVTAFFIFKFVDDFYNSRMDDFEKRYIEKNKILIKNEVERSIQRAEILKDLEYENNKNKLEEKIDFVQKVLDNKYTNIKSAEEFVKSYKKELDLYKWDNNTGYIYIFNYKGKVLYHGYNETLLSKNIFDIAKNNPELDSFLSETLKKDENYGSYKWQMPNINNNQLFKKYVYIKKYQRLKIFIAAGVYKKEMDKKLIDLYINELKKDRFGESDYGYFWVQNTEAKVIMHPQSPELIGKDFDFFKDYTESYNFVSEISKKALENGSGYITYKWKRVDKNGELDEKTSYYRLIKDWNIIVGSGFYLGELKALLSNEKKQLKRLINIYVVNTLTILAILTIISIIIGIYVHHNIKNIEDERIENYNMLKQYKLILDETSVVSKSNTEGIITYVNDNFEKVSGYDKSNILGKSYSVIKHPENPKRLFKELWETISRGKIWKGIIKNQTKNAETYYNKTTIVPIKDSNEQIIEYISSSIDVTELIENKTKLNDLFRNDPLTGLRNRVSLISHLARNENALLALINIDRFKEVNDSFNQNVGDMVIKELANRLFDFFSYNKYKIYRVQADIFAIHLIDNDNKKFIQKIEKFMDTVGKKPYKIEDKNFILTYTCGVAASDNNLFTYAEVALSEAKKKKVRIKEYDNSMKSIEGFRNNLLWVERLHLALAENRIIAHYQPIYNYKTGKIEKYEALMRLIENGKIIYPNEYLSIAKKTRLYPELTYKMVEKVISKFSLIDKEFSINLSVEDLMNEELMSYLYDFAEQKEVFSKMVLEIVESEEIEDSTSIANLLKRFKDRGCKIAIDDFGSGYSNYDYLIKLQADYIKIDGSIIKHILEDDKTQTLVKSIVSFAKKSNIKVIAEFVSSKELDELLKDLDIDYAQGFYHGKPMEELVEA
ncbi:hypothetical protein CRV08_14700 [Halarcobacter ebronensis]|uniref:Diguanylate cyclase n=1 Tax=Halarcobacter ebronensis TaxID=1462615 RepID=A0A4Q0Y788_9BACT|nr:EAL domain-containing protein [Halarcobacter ebronensis]RXJ65615.1 hypothetical protein CRV08_14700 [Halarcobacter ebronensis]